MIAKTPAAARKSARGDEVSDPPSTSGRGTLSALAAALGEIEPELGHDMTDHHRQALAVLMHAAPRLPIRSAADATLAVSAARELLNRVLTGRDDAALLDAVEVVLARLAGWLREAQGATAMHVMWLPGELEIVLGDTALPQLRASRASIGGAA